MDSLRDNDHRHGSAALGVEYLNASKARLMTELKQKHWQMVDAAFFLGVSRQRLYSALDDPRRARIWDLAITGLPECSDQLARDIRKLRLDRRKNASPSPAAAPTSADYGYRVGDVVMAIAYAGIAEDGDEGWIVGIKGATSAPEMLVRMPQGEDWFPLADFERYFVTTGKTHS